MPRKAVQQPVEPEGPPPLTPFEESNVAYCVAKDVVDDLIERGGDTLYEHYLQAKEIILAAKRSVEDMNDIIRSAFLIRDAGEVGNDEGWYEDDEPKPASIDSWARGAVPSKKKRISFLDEFGNGEGGVGSVRSGRSASSRRRRTRSSKGKKHKGGDDNASPPTIITRAATPSKSLKAISDKNLLTPTTSNEVKEFEEQAKQERLRLEELRRKRQAEDDLFLSYRDREDLQDKQYTFTADGDLLVIQSPDRSKLPGTGIQLGRTFKMKEETPEVDPSPEPEEVPEELPVKKKKKKRRGKSRRGSKEALKNSEYFQEDLSRQPALITTIRLASGVGLMEGNQEKQGTNRLADPLHMSLADFKEHQRNLEDQPKEKNDDYTMDATLDIEVDEFDLTSGARVRGPGKGGSDPPQYYDPNDDLINSADWGRSSTNPHAYEPPLRPDRIKDALHHYEITVGRIVQKPRDRPYSRQSTEASPEKFRLPQIPVSDVGRKLQEDPEFSRRTRYEQTFGSKKKGSLNVTNQQALQDLFPAGKPRV